MAIAHIGTASHPVGTSYQAARSWAWSLTYGEGTHSMNRPGGFFLPRSGTLSGTEAGKGRGYAMDYLARIKNTGVPAGAKPRASRTLPSLTGSTPRQLRHTFRHTVLA